MLIEVSADENSAIISVPFDELKKFGLNVGDQIEVLQNENDEIVLRPVISDRKKRILEATREIVEERRSALIELGKGHE